MIAEMRSAGTVVAVNASATASVFKSRDPCLVAAAHARLPHLATARRP